LNCFFQGYERGQAKQVERRREAEQERQTMELAADARRQQEGARRQQTAAAEQAYTLMEELRQSVSGVLASNDSEQKIIDDAKSSWWKMQKMYCNRTPSGHYIDLEGKDKSCKTE